jgi:hypothetical protein
MPSAQLLSCPRADRASNPGLPARFSTTCALPVTPTRSVKDEIALRAAAARFHLGTKASAPPGIPGALSGLEVGTVITVFTVDAALESTCAVFRERAQRGDITPAERDLLTDGAVLLAMHIDDLAAVGPAGPSPSRPRPARRTRAGRHERYQAAPAA